MASPEDFHEPRGADEGFPHTWWGVVSEPHAFFAEMPETGGLGAPTTFLALCAAVHAAGHLLTGNGLGTALWVLAWQTIGAFVLAAVLVLAAQHLFGGHAGFEPTFRAVAYAMAPSVVYWIPFHGVAQVAFLYAGYLTVRGIERVQGLDTTRALLTVGVGLAALGLLAGRTMWPHPAC